MKNTNNVSKKHHVYGIIGMVALFLMGGLIGFILTPVQKHFSVMNERQCETIYKRMDDAIKYLRYDEYEKLSKMFTRNCLAYNFDKAEQQSDEAEVIQQPTEQLSTCQKIENALIVRIGCTDGNDCNSYGHLNDAQTYANLSDRGCPENSEKYKALAQQELELARALNDDSLEDTDEAREIVETYKRLQLQQEAEKMLEKAKKLTNPAIDFILELEKIIEE